jgi:hypothetical protein
MLIPQLSLVNSQIRRNRLRTQCAQPVDLSLRIAGSHGQTGGNQLVRITGFMKSKLKL